MVNKKIHRNQVNVIKQLTSLENTIFNFLTISYDFIFAYPLLISCNNLYFINNYQQMHFIKILIQNNKAQKKFHKIYLKNYFTKSLIKILNYNYNYSTLDTNVKNH